MNTTQIIKRIRYLVFLAGLSVAQPCFAQESQPTTQSIDAIRKAGKGGAGFDQALVAAKQLRSTPISQLSLLLDGLADANPIAQNWIRGVVFDVVRRSDKIPVDSLTEYAMDAANNPTGRGLAMELIQRDSPAIAQQLISECLDDVSLPLREMAVQQKIETAQDVQKEDPESSKSTFREALAAARHPQQLETIVESLRKLGDDDVSISSAFAMIEKWNSLGPFNNVGGVGFDTPYEPESEFASGVNVDLTAEYKGKNGAIQWQEVTAIGDKGEVNLAKTYDKEKGAVCYLYTEFDSSETRPAEVRLGSKNANKVWINGELVMENEVYHSGFMIDQYVAATKLKKGTNKILVKICQNEQTESWAQDWKFQLRITNTAGKALQSGD